MIRKTVAYLICGVALLLPCRLRIIYGEVIGWFLQFFYYIYYFTMKKILTTLKINEKK